MMRAAVLAVLLVPAAVIGLDPPLVMAGSHLTEGAFVTTWNVTASPYTISIPVEVHTGGTLTIDWGDTTTTTVDTNGTQSHTYSASGEYRVSMTGDLSRIILGDVGSTAGKLASIDQWGDIEWSSMKSAFPYTHNMKYNASDVPNLSGVSSMENMFKRALKFDGDLSEWNVSAVTDMHDVFTHASSFNGNVSTWNVSAVTDMGYMFNGASVFNGDISSWNVSAVTNMRDMFDSASVFNGDISRWNVSAVTNMAEMFHIASVFKGDISSWNVSAVTDMNRMFSSASVFKGDISSWNVSAVTDMHRMFSQAFAFNGDISSWNVSSVTDMSHMFSRATSFDSDISGWNVSSVKDTSYMFSSARSFNQPLNSWNVSAVTAMTDMFLDSRSFNQNLGEWYILPAEAAYDITDASLNVTVISAQNFILDGHNPTYGIDPDDGLDSGLFNMTGSTLMFKVTPYVGTYTVNVTASGSSVFERGNNWRTLTVTVTGQEDRPLLVDVGPDQRVLDESEVTLSGTVSDSDSTDLTYLWTQNPSSPAVTLANSDKLTSTFTAPDVSSDVDLIFTLTVDDGTDTVTDTVTVTVHDAEADFVTTWSDITIGINIPIRSSVGSFTVDWGDGKITEYDAIATNAGLAHLYNIPGTHTIRISGNFSGIFLGDDTNTAGKLQSIDQWGDIEWTTMAGAFYHAVNMIYNAIDVPDLSSVTDMSFMFARTGFSSGDLSGWNVSGVTDMRNMFLSSSYTGDLSGWDVSSVTDMQNMFSRASSFDSDLSDWDVSAVNSMNSMFFRASSFDSDLSGWNVSSVTSMQNMFLYATSFNSDLSGWNVSAVNNMDDMFSGATSFEQNLGPWYIVLDSDTISYPTQTLEIMAQNLFLGRQSPMYGLVMGDDPDLFVVDAAARTLGLNPNSDPSPPPNGIYQVNVTSMGSFGTANHRTVEVTVDNADPAVMPPTFYSSVFNNVTGVLTIVFSETIDVTPATNIVPTKIHIRESGNYTGGITLSVSELDTTSDDATISFTLTQSQLTTVAGLNSTELTIEPGAVQDTSSNLIDGTFDASTAVFVDATSVASRDDKPQGMAFSSDGTKMFVVGDQNNVIIEYTLSPAFDVSSAVFADTFPVASEDGIPTGMAFSDDGTKMFVIGDSGNNINEYTLTTAFDVSSASYDGDIERFSFSSERSYPTDMAFSNDGTQMFVLDNTNDEINEYTLSTPFDISNATSTDVIFSVTEEEDFPLGIAFSNDGAKMFVVGGNDVNEYTLKAAFDIFNATFVDATALISSGDIATSGIAFSNDGAKMFAITYFGDEIYEYTLSSVYPITVNDTVAPDTTPPTLSLTGNTSVTISVGTTYNDEGATCEDAVDGTIIPTVVSNTVDTTQTGNYAVTYSCTDAANNSAIQVTRTVTVEAAPDTTPPTLSLTGNTSVTISVGTTYNDEGATCEDAVDGTIIPTVVSNTVDTTQTGNYAVTYSCTDAANNSATQVSRTVIVQTAVTPDTTPPTLSLTGNTSVTISVGTTYNDEGATCEDAVDGTIIPTVVSNTVDTTQTGNYAVTYSCTDAANNSATQVSRTVIVQTAVTPDTTPPTLSLTGNTSVTISVGTTYNDEGATCEDAVDGTIIPTVVSNTVDTTQTGNYAVTYSCTDAANNSAIQVTRTVTVEAAPDTTPPTLSLTGNTSVTISVGTTYNDEGATCEDAVDGTIIPTVVSNTVDTTQTGNYAVTYSCTDAANNSATQVSRTVIVQTAVTPDTTPPTLSLTGNTSVTISVGTTYNDEGATCEDAVDGTIIPTVVSNTVDTTQTGNYAVTYSCTDAANNSATQVSRTVIVQTAVTPDTTPPTLSLTGNTSVTISVGTTYNDEGATCEDAVDGTIIPTVVSNTVDTTQTGNYAVTYSCTDAANNSATQVSRTVIVQTAVTPDTTPPTLSLTGNTSVTISVGTTYNDEGATCEDAVDGTIIPTVVSNTVDTTQTGNYAVTYSCTDAANNSATQVSRTVIVQTAVTPDTTPPTLSLTGNTSVTISVGTTYNDEGATCEDAVDGTIIPTVVSNTVDTTQTGNYAVTYSCTDAANNSATQVSRTVIVQTAVTPDTTPPTLSLTGNTSVTISVGTTYNDEGATCEDAVDGTIIPTVVSNTVDTTQTGNYAVTYSCTDDAGNNATPVSRTVLVHEVGEYQRSSSRSVPLTTDSSMTINGQSYQLGSGTATIEPYTVTTGHDTDIEFIAYSTEDIIHFTVYLDLHDNDVGYSDRGTYVRYDQGTVKTNDPNGFISYASITITEDEEDSDKKIISVVIEFDGAMGLTNIVVYMWNEDRGSSFIRIFDALDVTTESEPVEPEPRQEPLAPDFADDATDPEPVSTDTLGPDDYDDAQVLHIIRMWSGFESEFITDEQMLASLGLDYPDADIPDWVMTQLGVLVAKGDVTVEEFVLALQYVLENL